MLPAATAIAPRLDYHFQCQVSYGHLQLQWLQGLASDAFGKQMPRLPKRIHAYVVPCADSAAVLIPGVNISIGFMYTYVYACLGGSSL